MIFITVGSQKFQFNRLLRAIDDLVANEFIKEEVFAQIGYSDYKPQNYKFKDFLDREEFGRIMEQCRIVITHGGTGAIIGAIKAGKKVIAVPRLAKYGEHVDDHQLQLIGQFTKSNLILSCENMADLRDTLKNIETKTFNTYESNTDSYITAIGQYIDGLNIG